MSCAGRAAHLDGFPGAGELNIGRAMQKHLPSARLLDSHLPIDLADAMEPNRSHSKTISSRSRLRQAGTGAAQSWPKPARHAGAVSLALKDARKKRSPLRARPSQRPILMWKLCAMRNKARSAINHWHLPLEGVFRKKKRHLGHGAILGVLRKVT